jgi:hypothetical protein
VNFNFRFFIPVVLISLAATAVAHAYIPPGQFIIKNMASKRTGTHLIRLVSQVNGYESGKPNGQRFKAVTIFNVQTHTMTSQALNDQGAELFGVEKKGETLPLALTLLYDSNTREIVAALKRAEIPVHIEENVPTASASATPDNPIPEATAADETTGLRRWQGSVAWVLGLSPTRKEGSQLWIEKDTFLPLRLIIGDQDIQFAKYRYSQDLPYPRTTALANRAGVIQLEEDTTEVKVNPKDKEPEHAPIAMGYTDAGNSSPLKELIRKYYAGLR